MPIGGGHMRIIFIAMALALIGQPAWAQFGFGLDKFCSTPGPSERRIKACSQLLRDDLSIARQGYYYNRALAYLEMGDLDHGIADLTNAIAEIDDEHHQAERVYLAGVVLTRGKAYMDKGNIDLAMRDISQSIALTSRQITQYSDNSETYAAYAGRASAYLLKGEYTKSLADAMKAVEIYPADIYALETRASVYEKLDRYDDAIADYNQAIAASPDADLYNNRAWAYHLKGEDANGLPDVMKSLEINPKNAPALETRGEIYEKLSKRDAAIADYRAALAGEPTMQPAKDGLARLGATP
ncbi:MAG: tetratricopeptide repeat protein [Rhizomicrobium sp.]